MKKRLLSLFLFLLLAGCSHAGTDKDDTIHVLATTYPVYLFSTAVTEGVKGVQVNLLVREQISCLHDYTLTIHDMKAIDRANVLVMNGAGLEEFLTAVLGQSNALTIDCSKGVNLLPALEEKEGHNHEAEFDPHIWMDPTRAAAMVEQIGDGLSQADPEHAELYQRNARFASDTLRTLKKALRETTALSLPHREMITFHDGFQYFAGAFDFSILKAIEEEEGAETSASELKEITELIEKYGLSSLFTEKNGSESTARALERETGCAIYSLNMMMSGDGSGLAPYVEAMTENVNTVMTALRGEEEVT